MRQVHITCDSCQVQYAPLVHERPIGQGGSIRQYLQCPHCQTQYTICDITANGVELRNRLKRMERMGQTGTPPFRSLLARYQREVTRLATQRETADVS